MRACLCVARLPARSAQAGRQVASFVGKNDEEGAKGLLVKVKERMAKPNDPLYAGAGNPLFVSDLPVRAVSRTQTGGDLSIPPAMLAVFGKEVEEPVHLSAVGTGRSRAEVEVSTYRTR